MEKYMNFSKSPWMLSKCFIGIVLNMILLCSMLGCTSSSDAENNMRSAMHVYVTKYGEKYHNIDCYHIKDDYEKLTLEEAEEQCYDACSKCW